MMPAGVLVVGGTGRTGGRVVQQLLDRGIPVRAIVRSGSPLPADTAGDPNLSVIEADLLSLTSKELQHHLLGCDVVISCLGHNLNLKGIFGAPRDLVTSAVMRICSGIESLEPVEPVRLILMSTVSVNQPGGRDTRRGRLERVVLAMLRALVPPARDNQRAADFLCREIGPGDPHVEWACVRPDTLLEGDVSEYAVHEGLVASLFRPDNTNMANVAHFMCELAVDPGVWERWRGGLPVIVNAVEVAEPSA